MYVNGCSATVYHVFVVGTVRFSGKGLDLCKGVGVGVSVVLCGYGGTVVRWEDVRFVFCSIIHVSKLITKLK